MKEILIGMNDNDKCIDQGIYSILSFNPNTMGQYYPEKPLTSQISMLQKDVNL